MPLYEYLCETCGRRTEALQRMDDPPLTSCPHCEGPLRKLLSAPAFQFKGSGWYQTDYARKSGGAGSSTEGGSSSEGSSTPAADGGESKPSAPEAPKAPAKPADG